MRIGIDIDDTITNSSDIFVEYAKQYNKEKNIQHKININLLDVKESYGWEKENLNEFLHKYLEVALNNIDSKSDSIEIINKLKKEGHEIYFITARSEREIEGGMFELTENWLNKHGFNYDLLVINSKEKVKDCIKYGIDIFIDDSYRNCKLIKDGIGIPVLLFTTRYNIKEKDESLIRVSNWYEIYNYLKSIQEEKL